MTITLGVTLTFEVSVEGKTVIALYRLILYYPGTDIPSLDTTQEGRTNCGRVEGRNKKLTTIPKLYLEALWKE